MFRALFSQENSFDSYGPQHFYSIGAFSVLCLIAIFIARRYLNENQRTALGVGLALIPMVSVLIRMYLTYYEGEFTYTEDLPLFICRIMTFILPLTMWYRHQYSFGILYFWILAGTFNAVVTPDVEFGYPHYTAWFYWGIHAGLIVAIVYAICVYKMRPYPRDFLRAAIAGFVYLACVHGVNLMLGSNYAYTMNKPVVASLFDYMGPWPIYLFVIQGIALVLFAITYLPYMIIDWRKKSTRM